MSGGYSRKGTAHINRIHRDMEAGKAAHVAKEREAAALRQTAARARQAVFDNLAPVDIDYVTAGMVALTRKRTVGTVARINTKTVTLRDSEGLEWRVNHDQIIRVEAPK